MTCAGRAQRARALCRTDHVCGAGQAWAVLAPGATRCSPVQPGNWRDRLGEFSLRCGCATVSTSTVYFTARCAVKETIECRSAALLLSSAAELSLDSTAVDQRNLLRECANGIECGNEVDVQCQPTVIRSCTADLPTAFAHAAAVDGRVGRRDSHPRHAAC